MPHSSTDSLASQRKISMYSMYTSLYLSNSLSMTCRMNIPLTRTIRNHCDISDQTPWLTYIISSILSFTSPSVISTEVVSFHHISIPQLYEASQSSFPCVHDSTMASKYHINRVFIDDREWSASFLFFSNRCNSTESFPHHHLNGSEAKTALGTF